MNKVTYVPAYFKPLGKLVTVAVPTGEHKRGLFGRAKTVTRQEKRWKQTGGWSQCQIDSVRLTRDIAKAVEELNALGYEVISMTSVLSGMYDACVGGLDSWGKWAYGYGYSYTDSVIIVARKWTQNPLSKV